MRFAPPAPLCWPGWPRRGQASRTPAEAQSSQRVSSAEPNKGPLGARLQGVQHFGLTVQNMDRAFAFYTEVLGGTEVMRDGDFQGERIHNTLLTDRRSKRGCAGSTRARGRAGPQRRRAAARRALHPVRQRRDRAAAVPRVQQPAGSGAAFAEPLDHMSPAFPRTMHICFHIRDDVDFNKFIHDLEAESARRGMTQVRANRVITVTTEKERLAAPMRPTATGSPKASRTGGH